MLEKIRRNLAIALMPSQKQVGKVLQLSSLSYPGQPVYTDLTVQKATREGYKLSLYVYRAVRTIVQAGSGIPWVVLDKNGEVIPNHPFELLLKRPNPEMSGQDLMEFLIAHLKLVGNALWQPLIVSGDIKELWIVMPDLVQPIPADIQGQWLKGYRVTEFQGGQHDVPPETFIHFMQFNPGNPYWGVGDLMAAARTVDTDNEAQDTQKLELQNRGIPPGVFQFDSDMSDEQHEEATRRVREIFLQKSKRGEPWVLGGGYKWQQMSLSPVEMDYIATRLTNKRDIAAAFGISPIFLGDLEQSSYNNMVEARKALYQDCVIPLLDDVESTLNLKIAPMYGNDIHITYDLSNVAALREDYGKKVEQAKSLWSMGVPFQQINDQLELGFEEFDGWDTGYLSVALLPAGETSTTEPAKMLNKGLNLANEEQKSSYWKRVDRRKMGWWSIIQKKVQPLYQHIGSEVSQAVSSEKAIKAPPTGLIEKAKVAIDKLSAEWQALLLASGFAVVEDFGKDAADAIGAGTFDPTTAAIRIWLKNHAAENVRTILDTQKEAMGKLIAKGVEDNLSTAEIAKSIRTFYDENARYLSMRVARSEVATASGYGSVAAAEQSGVAVTKTWLSSRDDRVRDSHQHIDGETVAMNELFSNGLEYPGDQRGDASESVNCRCVLTFHS